MKQQTNNKTNKLTDIMGNPIALSFNARTVKPSEGTNPTIPAGWYNATVKSGELKVTKGASPGEALVIGFHIDDGPQAGAHVTNKFTISNKNPEAVRIGQADLSALCHATQRLDVSNDQVFNGARVQIKVGFEKQSAAQLEKYGEKNKVSAFKAIDCALPNTGPSAFVPAGPTLPAAMPAPVPAALAPVAVPTPAPAPVASFPPAGWEAHPTAPGYFHNGAEALTEADLRARFAPAPVPVAAPVPAPVVVTAPAPAIASVAVVSFPPAGWLQHPESPLHFYCGTEVLTEADLRAKFAAPVAPSADVPPWEQ